MKPLIIANWKCNPKSLAEAMKLFNLLSRGVKDIENVKIVIAPPFVYLPYMLNSKFILGAQDCFWDKGPYTGEISPEMLKNLGTEYVILGHSERRRHLRETDEMINKKIKAVLKSGLKPIVCVADLKQLNSLKEIKNLIIAFEPVSAVGTGNAYNVEKAKKMRKAIKCPVVLYGGSVNYSDNAKDYIGKAGFQGLLVGGASLDVRRFIEIVKRIC